MGNCMFKEIYSTQTTNSSSSSSTLRQMVAEQKSMIKVVTTTGGIMELYAPITAQQITSEFPNHGLFLGPNPNPAHPPLMHSDNLSPGELYYLLPLSFSSTSSSSTTTNNSSLLATPYRMSVDVAPRVVHKDQADPGLMPGNNGSGMWKVRLVINPEYLSEILSQDNKTQQLIESVRTVAKCGSGSGSGSSSATKTTSSEGSSGNSDQCSVSSCNFHWKG